MPHYRVSTDFILQAGDVLYLTGDYKQAQLFAEVVGYELLDSETELATLSEVDTNVASEKETVVEKLGQGRPAKRLLVQVGCLEHAWGLSLQARWRCHESPLCRQL